MDPRQSWKLWAEKDEKVMKATSQKYNDVSRTFLPI
jgi:hypothetical protein